jgi:uncharacterized circularly permuted ATP-grasp superfamily protein
LQPSTTPALHNGRLMPHKASCALFWSAARKGYATLPGGLTRCTSGHMLSAQSGALNKDTWITPAIELIRPLAADGYAAQGAKPDSKADNRSRKY